MVKRSLKTILFCVALLAAMLAGLWLLRTAPAPGDAELEEALPVFSAPALVSRIEVENTQGSFAVVGDLSNPDSPDYRLESLDDLVPLYTGKILALVSASESLSASDLVGEAVDDLRQYGLDAPAATATITFSDGTSTSLLIGGGAPDDFSVYLMARGDHLALPETAVYLLPVSRVEHFLLDQRDLVSPLITGVGASGAMFDQALFYGSVRGDDTFSIQRRQTEGSASTYHLIQAPIERQVHAWYGISDLQAVFGMTATAVLEVNPDAETMRSYGFDTIYSGVKLVRPTLDVITGNTAGSWAEAGDITLYTAAPDQDGNVALCREGVPVIYQVPVYSLPWLEMQYYDFISPYLFSPTIDEVAGIQVWDGARTWTFSLLQTQPEGQPAQIAVTLDGEALPFDRFQPYYQTLVTAWTTQFTLDWPADDSPAQLLRLTFTYQDPARAPDTLTIYQGVEPRRHFVALGDETPCFYVASSWVNRVLEDVARLAAGETVVAWQ